MEGGCRERAACDAAEAPVPTVLSPVGRSQMRLEVRLVAGGGGRPGVRLMERPGRAGRTAASSTTQTGSPATSTRREAQLPQCRNGFVWHPIEAQKHRRAVAGLSEGLHQVTPRERGATPPLTRDDLPEEPALLIP